MDDQNVYPRLLRRVQALLIDSFIFLLVILAWWLSLPFLQHYPAWVKLLYPTIAWLILDPMLVSFTGGTPGHHMRNIVIQKRVQGRHIGLFGSVVRSVLKAITGWWSFIFVLTTKRHQALHDLVTGTVALLDKPDLLPKYERQTARYSDTDEYNYPSKIRRLLMIILYFTVETVALIMIQPLLLSSQCIQVGNCTALDSSIVFIVSNLWLITIIFTIVFGWRAHLFGARKQKKALPSQAKAS